MPTPPPIPAYAPLDIAHLRARLADATVGHTLLYYPKVVSTMPLAAALADDPSVRSGALVIAEVQTQGRGRGERSWHTPPAAALLLSVLLKPPQLALPLSHLPMLAGVALREAVATAAPALAANLQLKWPNDLLVAHLPDTQPQHVSDQHVPDQHVPDNGHNPATVAKVAGILIETSLAADGSPRYAVLGLGINVNQSRDDLPRIAPPAPRPTSLRLALGQPLDRGELLVALCMSLGRALALPADTLFARWRADLSTLGQPVSVYPRLDSPQPPLLGRAIDVAPDGALLVLDDAGATHTLHAADVSIRPPSPHPATFPPPSA